MNTAELKALLDDLVTNHQENEWVEFKLNFHSPEEIGQDISALANGACLHNQRYGYLVFGVEDKTLAIKGTTFKAKTHKKGNEDLTHWLVQLLQPKIDFRAYEFDYDDKRHISMYIIPAANGISVKFSNIAYIRINSATKKLVEHPEIEKKIWQKDPVPFEKGIAKDNLSPSDIIQYLNTDKYFDLMKLPHPSTHDKIIEKCIEEGLVIQNKKYAITNLGAILFARKLKDFEDLARKAVRVIVYKGNNKIEAEREQLGTMGYVLGFDGLIDWVNGQLPVNEEIGKVLRAETRMYPEIAIRELIANALIHQDFNEKGFPMIEIYTDRVEISNAGTPLINTDRFIDGYQSRNDKLADIMRRMGFCEERGSGFDKVYSYNEISQLPPISVLAAEKRTHVIMYSYKSLNELNSKEKIQACYQHACLKYVMRQKMTNQSLRERFKIEDQNAATVSRIIKDTLEEDLIKLDDPESTSRKYASYVPYWA